jgi:hypothetical protein
VHGLGVHGLGVHGLIVPHVPPPDHEALIFRGCFRESKVDFLTSGRHWRVDCSTVCCRLPTSFCKRQGYILLKRHVIRSHISAPALNRNHHSDHALDLLTGLVEMTVVLAGAVLILTVVIYRFL